MEYDHLQNNTFAPLFWKWKCSCSIGSIAQAPLVMQKMAKCTTTAFMTPRSTVVAITEMPWLFGVSGIDGASWVCYVVVRKVVSSRPGALDSNHTVSSGCWGCCWRRPKCGGWLSVSLLPFWDLEVLSSRFRNALSFLGQFTVISMFTS